MFIELCVSERIYKVNGSLMIRYLEMDGGGRLRYYKSYDV